MPSGTLPEWTLELAEQGESSRARCCRPDVPILTNRHAADSLDQSSPLPFNVMRDGAAKRGERFGALTGRGGHQQQSLQDTFNSVAGQVNRRAWTADLKKRRAVVESLVCNPVIPAGVNVGRYCHNTFDILLLQPAGHKGLPSFAGKYGMRALPDREPDAELILRGTSPQGL